MVDPGLIVGQRLKALRAERGLTVRDLARVSDLAFTTISMIERGKMSPTVSTLHKLSIALGVPLAYFVSESPPEPVIHLRRQERRPAHSAHVLLENLGASGPDQPLQLLLLTLQADADSGPEMILHLGQEFAFCLEGRIEYEVDDKPYTLEPEDSLLFEAHLPHRWRNCQNAPSRLLLVLHASQGHEAALRRHIESAGRKRLSARANGMEREAPDGSR
jgi:transcriptional regulator with XRE-family HTH domain